MNRSKQRIRANQMIICNIIENCYKSPFNNKKNRIVTSLPTSKISIKRSRTQKRSTSTKSSRINRRSIISAIHTNDINSGVNLERAYSLHSNMNKTIYKSHGRRNTRNCKQILPMITNKLNGPDIRIKTGKYKYLPRNDIGNHIKVRSQEIKQCHTDLSIEEQKCYGDRFPQGYEKLKMLGK